MGINYQGKSMKITTVNHRNALIEHDFSSCAVLLMRRKFTGDFNALALALEDFGSLMRADQRRNMVLLHKKLVSFAQNETGALAEPALAVLDDMAFYTRRGFSIELRLERCFNRSSDDAPFHQDRLDDFGRILCSYNDPTTEWIELEDAVSQRNTGLFMAKPGAEIHRFGSGDMWRFAGTQNKNGMPALIHRAPKTKIGDPPRLLLVADQGFFS